MNTMLLTKERRKEVKYRFMNRISSLIMGVKGKATLDHKLYQIMVLKDLAESSSAGG